MVALWLSFLIGSIILKSQFSVAVVIVNALSLNILSTVCSQVVLSLNLSLVVLAAGGLWWAAGIVVGQWWGKREIVYVCVAQSIWTRAYRSEPGAIFLLWLLISRNLSISGTQESGPCCPSCWLSIHLHSPWHSLPRRPIDAASLSLPCKYRTPPFPSPLFPFVILFPPALSYPP